MEIVVEVENTEDAQSAIDERTRALKLIRSLVNIYRLCYAVPSSI